MALTYGVIWSSDAASIDFNEVKQDSPATCITSVTSPEKCIIKWEGTGPTAIFGSPPTVNLVVEDGRTEHTNAQIKTILAGPDWPAPENP